MPAFTIDEYRRSYPVNGKVMSDQTIRRMIKSNLLPSNHLARKGKQWFIEVNFNNGEDLKNACLHFHRLKKAHVNNLRELSNTIAIKFNIDSSYLAIILGV